MTTFGGFGSYRIYSSACIFVVALYNFMISNPITIALKEKKIAMIQYFKEHPAVIRITNQNSIVGNNTWVNLSFNALHSHLSQYLPNKNQISFIYLLVCFFFFQRTKKLYFKITWEWVVKQHDSGLFRLLISPQVSIWVSIKK